MRDYAQYLFLYHFSTKPDDELNEIYLVCGNGSRKISNLRNCVCMSQNALGVQVCVRTNVSRCAQHYSVIMTTNSLIAQSNVYHSFLLKWIKSERIAASVCTMCKSLCAYSSVVVVGATCIHTYTFVWVGFALERSCGRAQFNTYIA